MIDSGLPLPDKDLMTNPDPNVTYGYGSYRKIYYCAECRYFETPNEYGAQIFWRECCPNCGDYKYYKRIAKYKLKRTKTGYWLFTKYVKEIIGIKLLGDRT